MVSWTPPPSTNRQGGIDWLYVGLFFVCLVALGVGAYECMIKGSSPWILLPSVTVGWWAIAHIKKK